jgi:hypothetical protein
MSLFREEVTQEQFLAAVRDGVAQGIRDLMYNPGAPASELMMRAIQRGVADGIERAAAPRGTP